MFDYQKDFISFALRQEVLRFGEFTLKSGRTSPYFFNAGLFSSGEALVQLGKSYAEAIVGSGLAFDLAREQKSCRKFTKRTQRVHRMY